jgi:hypothetical protein
MLLGGAAERSSSGASPAVAPRKGFWSRAPR